MGKLNCFYIDIHNNKPRAILTNVSESEFKMLFQNYKSESSGFNIGLFTRYMNQNGYYVRTFEEFLYPPYNLK